MNNTEHREIIFLYFMFVRLRINLRKSVYSASGRTGVKSFFFYNYAKWEEWHCLSAWAASHMHAVSSVDNDAVTFS